MCNVLHGYCLPDVYCIHHTQRLPVNAKEAVCVCVCVRVRACVCVCVRACVCARAARCMACM